MAEGPGKYDKVCSAIREECRAEGVMLAVINGIFGSGFSIQMEDSKNAALLPDVLRSVANNLEADLKRKDSNERTSN